MELEDIPLLVFALGIAALAFVGFVSDMQVINKNITTDTSSFNTTYNQINAEQIRINQSTNVLFNSGVNSLFTFLPTIQSFFGVMGIMLGSIGVLIQIFNDVARSLGLPTWALASLIAIISVGFMFAIYRATLGRLKL